MKKLKITHDKAIAFLLFKNITGGTLIEFEIDGQTKQVNVNKLFGAREHDHQKWMFFKGTPAFTWLLTGSISNEVDKPRMLINFNEHPVDEDVLISMTDAEKIEYKSILTLHVELTELMIIGQHYVGKLVEIEGQEQVVC